MHFLFLPKYIFYRTCSFLLIIFKVLYLKTKKVIDKHILVKHDYYIFKAIIILLLYY